MSEKPMNEQSMSRRYSRRSMLKHAAVAGAAGAVPTTIFAQQPEPYSNLTAAEGATLDAIVARLIPTDANGPGATEAGAARYIDRALGGWLAASLPAYQAGLVALDALARSRHDRAFVGLSDAAQDALLTVIEQNAGQTSRSQNPAGAAADGAADITAFPDSPASFFDMVLEHTIQGTFCDPVYGGNRDFIGWAMLGYPGIRLAVSTGDQALDAAPEPTGVSAYDLPMFDDTGESR